MRILLSKIDSMQPALFVHLQRVLSVRRKLKLKSERPNTKDQLFKTDAALRPDLFYKTTVSDPRLTVRIEIRPTKC